jgi:hypothetical protein
MFPLPAGSVNASESRQRPDRAARTARSLVPNTEHLYDFHTGGRPVENRPTRRGRAVENPSPNVDRHPPSVDTRAVSVESANHHI